MTPLMNCLHNYFIGLGFTCKELEGSSIPFFWYDAPDEQTMWVEMYASGMLVVLDLHRLPRHKVSISFFGTYFPDDQPEYLRRVDTFLRENECVAAIRQHRLKILSALRTP